MRIEPLPPARTLEVIALRLPLTPTFLGEWPTAPGSARRDPSGGPVILYVAPGRWLIPAAQADVMPLVAVATASDACAIIDISGKFLGFRLTGARAGRVLASTLDIEAVLQSRDCASTILFDCPVVVAKTPGEYRVWVQRSYSTDFLSALRNQLSLQTSRHAPDDRETLRVRGRFD